MRLLCGCLLLPRHLSVESGAGLYEIVNPPVVSGLLVGYCACGLLRHWCLFVGAAAGCCQWYRVRVGVRLAVSSAWLVAVSFSCCIILASSVLGCGGSVVGWWFLVLDVCALP